MQFLSTSENQILAPGVAVGDVSLSSAALPTSAAPGDVVTVLPNKGGFKIQAGSVNGVAGGKDCFKAEIHVTVGDAGTGYNDGDEIVVKKGNTPVMTLNVVTDGAGAVTGVAAADTRTNAIAVGDALTVDCNGDATATATTSNPNAAVKCIYTTGGKWVCECVSASGARRAL